MNLLSFPAYSFQLSHPPKTNTTCSKLRRFVGNAQVLRCGDDSTGIDCVHLLPKWNRGTQKNRTKGPGQLRILSSVQVETETEAKSDIPVKGPGQLRILSSVQVETETEAKSDIPVKDPAQVQILSDDLRAEAKSDINVKPTFAKCNSVSENGKKELLKCGCGRKIVTSGHMKEIGMLVLGLGVIVLSLPLLFRVLSPPVSMNTNKSLISLNIFNINIFPKSSSGHWVRAVVPDWVNILSNICKKIWK